MIYMAMECSGHRLKTVIKHELHLCVKLVLRDRNAKAPLKYVRVSLLLDLFRTAEFAQSFIDFKLKWKARRLPADSLSKSVT